MVEGTSRQGGGDAIHSFIHSFIHSSSFIFSLLVVICFEVVWGGGTVGHNVVQYSEGGGVWGSLRAILVRGLRETC